MDKVWNGAGKPLGEDIRRLGREELIALALEVCEGAADCGAAFHGNIHPGNITRDAEGRSRLGPRADHAPGDWSTDELEYMAPELFWNGTADASADVYSIGLLLYAGVTGGLLPFFKRAPENMTNELRASALRRRMNGDEIHTPAAAGEKLGPVIEKCLKFEVSARYKDTRELAEALRPCVGEGDAKAMEMFGKPERELSEVKALGFNLLRKHAKIEPQRWYYHCDKLGLIVWQDMVNGGGPYKLWFVTYLTNVFQPLLRRLPDARPLWGLLGRETEAGREEYARELEATVKALQCHPCVGCWVPFNEGWGQFDAAGAVEAVRRLDGTRLVDEASGWYDQGGGDVDSLHNYFYPLRVRPRSRVVALSEYGGIAWPMPGHEPPRRAYGYGTAKSRAELTARWKKLQLETVLPQLKKGLSALVYTQVSDVEDEVNGLFTYDRTAIKPDAAAVRAVNEALEVEFEKAVKE